MDKFEIIDTLGRGSYGQALLAFKRDSKLKCVVKEIKVSHLNPEGIECAKKEVKVLSSLTHPHITKFYESFENVGNLYIVMEYCSGGDLQKLIKSRNGIYFPEIRIVEWLIQLCLAIKFVHTRHIIHRDIKTQNVFLTSEGRIKLGDFGIAKILDKTSDLANTCIGTPYYISPEICENKPYSNKSDIWALGCVLYEMLALKHAYDANNIRALIIKIIKCAYPSIPSHYSRDLKILVQSIFQRDPKLRPSIFTILNNNIILRKLPKFLTDFDADIMNTHRTKVRPVNPAMRRVAFRARLGISSPHSKYGNAPKISVSYPNITRACSHVNHSRTSSKVKRDNETIVSAPCMKPMKTPALPLTGGRFSLKDRTKSLSFPLKCNSKVENPMNSKPKCPLSGDLKSKSTAHPKKVSLLMKESLESFKRIDVSDSILLNLDKMEDSISSQELQNSSGWLVDLYLSQKLLGLQRDLKHSCYTQGHQHCAPLDKDNVIPKLSPIEIEENGAFQCVPDRLLACNQEKVILKSDFNDLGSEQSYMSTSEIERVSECALSPISSDLNTFSPPSDCHRRMEESDTSLKSTKKRKNWSNGPSDIISILASTQLQEGTSSCKLNCLTRDDVQILDSLSFRNEKEFDRMDEKITFDDYQCEAREDGTKDDPISNNVMGQLFKGERPSVKDAVKESRLSMGETFIIPNLVTCQNQGMESNRIACPIEQNRTIIDSDLTSTDIFYDNLHSEKLTKEFEMDSGKQFSSRQEKVLENNPSLVTKPKRRFFSFLHRYSSEKVEPDELVKKSVSCLSTPKSRAHFSALLRKFLQKESISDTTRLENPRTTPSPVKENQRTTSFPVKENESTTSSSVKENERITPSSVIENERTAPSSVIENERAIPSSVTENERTAPFSVIDNERTAPFSVIDNGRTTPTSVIDNERTTPSSVTENERTAPSSVIDNERTTPSSVIDNERTTPSSVIENERTISTSIIQNERTTSSSVIKIDRNMPSPIFKNDRTTASPTLENYSYVFQNQGTSTPEVFENETTTPYEMFKTEIICNSPIFDNEKTRTFSLLKSETTPSPLLENETTSTSQILTNERILPSSIILENETTTSYQEFENANIYYSSISETENTTPSQILGNERILTFPVIEDANIDNKCTPSHCKPLPHSNGMKYKSGLQLQGSPSLDSSNALDTSSTFDFENTFVTIKKESYPVELPTSLDHYQLSYEGYLHEIASNIVANVVKAAMAKLGQHEDYCNRKLVSSNSYIEPRVCMGTHTDNIIDSRPVLMAWNSLDSLIDGHRFAKIIKSNYTNGNVPQREIIQGKSAIQDIPPRPRSVHGDDMNRGQVVFDYMTQENGDFESENKSSGCTGFEVDEPTFSCRQRCSQLIENSQHIPNFQKLIENLLCNQDEVPKGRKCDQLCYAGLFHSQAIDGDICGWIEAQRAKMEDILGLELFLEAYRCLESSFECGGAFELKEALNLVKMMIGPGNEELANDILNLIVAESVHLN